METASGGDQTPASGGGGFELGPTNIGMSFLSFKKYGWSIPFHVDPYTIGMHFFEWINGNKSYL